MVFKLKTTWYEVGLSGFLFMYFLFGLANIAGLKETATFYGLVALGGLVLGFFGDLFMPDKFQKPQIKLTRNNLLVGSVIIIGFMIWYLQGTGFAIVAAPEFASIELDNTGQAINSGLAGMSEDNLFFYAAPLFAAAMIYKFTKRFELAVITYFAVGIIGFTAYHWARYGTDMPALTTTFMFAIFNTTAVYMTAFLIWSHLSHFLNNFLISIFKTMTITTLLFMIASNPMTWFVIIGAIVVFYLYKKK